MTYKLSKRNTNVKSVIKYYRKRNKNEYGARFEKNVHNR